MLQIRNISKRYVTGDLTQVALDNITLDFRDSEFVAILGPSGSGKTTLLNVVGGLDRYDSGDLIINGVTTKGFSEKDWDAYRNHTVGFVFQNYNLITHQTVLSNVEIALTISGVNKAEREERAMRALREVGLEDQVHKKPNQLSGGQMQRVAIARALVNNPDIILADEPTGALDSKTSVQIMDLLKEVAKDRLVIMVTHNPELAEEYATRIINLKDGKIVSDTEKAESETGELLKAPPKHTKLSFWNALSLSISNLLTKKGRTFLTSFAGSVGIIGIALILALTNGMNAYIASVESDMLGSYPVRLRKQTIDMQGVMNTAQTNSSVMSGLTGSVSESLLGDSDAANSKRVVPKGKFQSDNTVEYSVGTSTDLVRNNDLKSFRKYLLRYYDTIKNDVTSVEYTYDLAPQVYRLDSKNGLVKVSPSSLEIEQNEAQTENMSIYNLVSSSLFNDVLSSEWQQLPQSAKLQKQQYQLLSGTWPKQYNEVALVIRPDGTISDYTLYMLGLMDISDMEQIVTAAEAGEKTSSKAKTFDYKDVIGMTFSCFAPSDLYAQSDGVYVDKSEDTAYMSGKIGEGTEIKISCVLQSTDKAELSNGVAYSAALTKYLMKKAADSPVVRAQKADPTTNVLTGKKFATVSDDTGLADSAGSLPAEGTSLVTGAPTVSYDMWHPKDTLENRQIAQQNLLQNRRPNVRAGNARQAGPEMNDVALQILQASLEEAMLQTFNGMYSQEQIERVVKRYLDSLSDEEKQELINKYVSSIDVNDIQSFAQKYGNNIDTKEVQKLAEEYLAKMSPEQKQALIKEFLDNMDQEEIQALIKQYINSMSTEQLQGLVQQYISGMSSEDLAALLKEGVGSMSQAQLQAIIRSYINSMSTAELQTLVTSYLSSMDQRTIQKYLTQYLLANQGKLLEILKSSLSSDQLKALIAQFSGDMPTTYDEVMKTVGYFEEDDPSMIAIYSSNFDGKKKVVSFIQDYNQQIDNPDHQVTYTDIIATVTSSLTDIIHTISYVLIAFVAISLIVSSIMIAIITWISVLERTKEIGILRALGSSKYDVSHIFNAETFIEGLISGLMGVIITWILCIPINHFVLAKFDISHVANLPVWYALALVVISVILTFIAGFIPARMAAKKDPVLALRSE